MHIKASGLDGHHCELELEGETSWQVRDVKKALVQIIGIPVHFQILVLGSQRLYNCQLLSDLRSDGSSMHVGYIRQCDGEIAAWLEDIETGRRVLDDSTPVRICADPEVVLAALDRQRDKLELFRFAGTALFEDEAFMIAAARINKDALFSAGSTLWSARSFVLSALDVEPTSVQHASTLLRQDRDFMMEAGVKEPWSLEYAGIELKVDAEFLQKVQTERRRRYVLAMVSRQGRNLARARDLRSDPRVALVAVRNDPHALQWVDSKAHADLELTRAMLANLSDIQQKLYLEIEQTAAMNREGHSAVS